MTRSQNSRGSLGVITSPRFCDCPRSPPGREALWKAVEEDPVGSGGLSFCPSFGRANSVSCIIQNAWFSVRVHRLRTMGSRIERLTSKIDSLHVPSSLRGAPTSLSHARVEEIFSNQGSRLIN